MSNVNTDGILNLLAQKGISRRELARRMDLDPSAILYLVRGTRRLKMDEVPTIAQATDTPRHQILELFGLDVAGDAPSTPLYNTTEVTGWLDGSLILRKEGLRGKRSVPMPFADKDVTALRFQTAGSEYASLDGSLLYFRPNQELKGFSPGQIAIVKIKGEKELRLRVVQKGYVSGKYNLGWLSGRIIEEEVALEYYYPVVWMKF